MKVVFFFLLFIIIKTSRHSSISAQTLSLSLPAHLQTPNKSHKKSLSIPFAYIKHSKVVSLRPSHFYSLPFISVAQTCENGGKFQFTLQQQQEEVKWTHSNWWATDQTSLTIVDTMTLKISKQYSNEREEKKIGHARLKQQQQTETEDKENCW